MRQFQIPYVTGDGAYVIPLINGTGGLSVKGQLVQVYTSGTDDTFITAPANPRATVGLPGFVCGVIYDDGAANGQICRVAIAGIAQVLLENGHRGEPLTAHEAVDGHGAGIEYSATDPYYAQGLGVIRDAYTPGGLTWCTIQIQHDVSVLITGLM